MKYLLLFIISTNFLFGYANLGGQNMETHTESGFNAYDININVGSLVQGSYQSIPIPIYLRTNQTTDIFTITSSNTSRIIGNKELKFKTVYKNLSTGQKTDLVYGSTTYNNNVEIWKNSFNGGYNLLGYIFIEYDINHSKVYESGDYTLDFDFLISNGYTSDSLTVTVDFTIDQFINLNFGNPNTNDKTPGTNFNDYDLYIGEIRQEELNELKIEIPTYLNTNSNEPISLTGINSFTTINNNQYAAEVKFIGNEETILSNGNNSNSVIVWSGGINEGLNQIGKVIVDPIYENMTMIEAGESVTTFGLIVRTE